MKRRNSKQPTDKKPVVANSELWRKLTESSQATVSGGLRDDDYDGSTGSSVKDLTNS